MTTAYVLPSATVAYLIKRAVANGRTEDEEVLKYLKSSAQSFESRITTIKSGGEPVFCNELQATQTALPALYIAIADIENKRASSLLSNADKPAT